MRKSVNQTTQEAKTLRNVAYTQISKHTKVVTNKID